MNPSHGYAERGYTSRTSMYAVSSSEGQYVGVKSAHSWPAPASASKSRVAQENLASLRLAQTDGACAPVTSVFRKCGAVAGQASRAIELCSPTLLSLS